jgi:hypothetical protein
MNKNFQFSIFNFLIILVISILFFPLGIEAAGASLYLAPSRGTFFVGSTFGLSVYVNTKGNEINAVEVDLKFPQDILQVTTPTAGESFISEWLTPPSYSNIGGTISFKGGIPEGIVTSAGLISTITFRAKAPGIAKVEISDASSVLLADGKGTPLSVAILEGVYEILVPPPEGPKVFSPTHYDSDIWYANPNPQFCWEREKGVTDFSFSLSQNPQEEPDTVSEGSSILFKSYREIPDGVWYFHLRAKKENVWGKTSHFGIKIDTAPPQTFEPRIDARAGFIYFETKDLYSGIDYYEISVLNITESPAPTPFFIIGTSPFKIPSRKVGKYNIIVRAYDKAGNWQEGETQFQILSPLFSYIEGEGIEFWGVLFSLQTIYLLLFVLLGVAAYLIFYFMSRRGLRGGIKEIKEALEEIEKIEERERKTKEIKERFREEKEKLEEKLR